MFEGFSWGGVVQGGAGLFARVLRRWWSGISTPAPRAGQASIIWGSWGVICAAARSRPRPRADTHKPYWLRAISRETTETSRPIRSAILRNDQPCSSPRAIAARSDIVNIRRNTTSRL